MYIFDNLKKINFLTKRIYFHDYKKSHIIINKKNNSDSIFVPLSGSLIFSIGKKKIILRKNYALLIKNKVTFSLKSSKSAFVVLANKDYKPRIN